MHAKTINIIKQYMKFLQYCQGGPLQSRRGGPSPSLFFPSRALSRSSLDYSETMQLLQEDIQPFLLLGYLMSENPFVVSNMEPERTEKDGTNSSLSPGVGRLFAFGLSLAMGLSTVALATFF